MKASATMNPMIGDVTIGISTLSTMPCDLSALDAGRDDRGAEQAADERVAARAREPQAPREQVPGDGADEGGGHDRLGRGRSSTSPEPMVLATAVPGEGADEVERRGHEDRVARPERPGRDRRRDRVRRVVEAVDVVERRPPAR